MGKTEYLALTEVSSARNATTDTEATTPTDNEDTAPALGNIMMHILPETNAARWSHIEDLDSFFTRIYNYHQQHGFTIILLDHIFQLCEFVFVIWLLTFTVFCLRHDVLFGNTLPQGNHTKVALNDVIIPMGECARGFSVVTYLLLVIAGVYFLMRLIKVLHRISHYSTIKRFYSTALHIEDSELDNTTWHDVKQKIRVVQAEQHMCIDKEQLTELDVCHRILRFKNYMVALMNQNLLPVRFKLPVVGEVVALSRGLMVNIDFILFRGPGAPFQNNCLLRDEYTVRSNQTELAQRLSKLIFWMAIVNFVLAPIIFVWQLIYICFSYANVLRKEPDALGMRTWSNYGRLYLRHFNELDHELDARLNRAYGYANRYLSSFSSPLMAVLAKNLLFITGGVLVLILALGIYDEYVFHVEHVLTIITALSAVGLVCRTLIPDENLVWCPEQLMTAILAHVHYIPADWRNQAHTSRVRKEFSHFFQPKAEYLLHEILSPLTTPFLLMFVFRPKSLEIVNFFRGFTVKVRGVGHVCSFAEMDLRKHGNPKWQLPNSLAPEPVAVTLHSSDKYSTSKEFPVEHGKTELSLMHFTLTNPEWRMPQAAADFIKAIRENAQHDLEKSMRVASSNPITESLVALGTIDEKYCLMATSVLMAHKNPNQVVGNSEHQFMESQARNAQSTRSGFAPNIFPAFKTSGTSQYMTASIGPGLNLGSTGPFDGMRKMRVSKAEGPLEAPTNSLLCSLNGLDPRLANNSTDIAVADMCLSTLYLHELHKQNTKVDALMTAEVVEDLSRHLRQVITSRTTAN